MHMEEAYWPFLTEEHFTQGDGTYHLTATSRCRLFSAFGMCSYRGAASSKLLTSQDLLLSMVPPSSPWDLPFSHSFCGVPQEHFYKAAPLSICPRSPVAPSSCATL